MQVDIFVHNLTSYDRKVLDKVMEAGGVSSYQLLPFKKKDTVRFVAPINVVCSDFQPVTEGNELVYYWPAPKTFMADDAKKKEVWIELSKSIVPYLDAMEKVQGEDPSISAARIFGNELTPERFAQLAEEWTREKKHLVVKDETGEMIHVFPKEKPGKYDKELTLSELLALCCALVTFKADVARVQREDNCLELSGSSYRSTS